MKILIVDDSTADRSIVIEGLKAEKIPNEIIEASDGEEAFKILSEQHKNIGLIILDWQMPKMDGMEFMKGAINVPETGTIPILMVTASGGEDSQKIAKLINPNLIGYVVKPYKLRTLIEIIKPYLG